MLFYRAGQLLAALAIAPLMAADVPSKDAPKDANQEAIAKDHKALRGLWQVVNLELSGRDAPKIGYKNVYFEFGDDNKFRLRGKEKDESEFQSYRIDPTKTPKEIDFKELFNIGIYKIDGDKLVIVWGAMGGKERPKDFETKSNSSLRLFRLERVKE